MLADGAGQRRSELLDPAQDRSAAHVDASIGEHAGDAFGRGTQLQIVPNGKQDDVTREAMTGDQAQGLGRRMPATFSAGINNATTLGVGVSASCPTRSAHPRPMSENPCGGPVAGGAGSDSDIAVAGHGTV
jgi:hypothetical protein